MNANTVSAAAGLTLACAAFGQFSGPYAPAAWTFNANGGSGSVNTGGAPASIVLTGNDALGANINTDYTVVAVATGTLSFSWRYETIDTGTYDAAYYLINGVQTFLANGTVFLPVTGVVGPIAVTAGTEFGFRVWSADGVFGPGVLTITSFSGPVPAPGGFMLAAIASPIVCRRRRR